MSFMGILGIGLAVNLLQGMFRPRPPTFNPSYFQSMSRTMAKHSRDMQKMWEKAPTVKKFSFDFKVPDPPKSVIARFQEMQQGHEKQQTEFLHKFQAKKNQAKEEYFTKNHYETRTDGKRNRVALKDGKPVIRKGGENEIQRQARLEYESDTQAKMFTRHNSQKQQFVNGQKQQILTFLDANKFQLSNPAIQGELSKLILDGQKKALKLQNEHEEEYYKVDMPVKEMQAMVDHNLAEYRQMQQQQLEEQRNSKEAMELAKYQEDIVAVLDAKREIVKEEKRAEMFAVDPRRMMKGRQVKLADVVPTNILQALYEFEVNEIPV